MKLYNNVRELYISANAAIRIVLYMTMLYRLASMNL